MKRIALLIFTLLVSTGAALAQDPPPPETGAPNGKAQRTAPFCSTQVEPNYTDEARKAGIEGTVVIDSTIQADGTITVNGVARGIGYGLDEEAVKALQKWQCTAGKVNGKPVVIQLQIVINFHLFKKPPQQ